MFFQNQQSQLGALFLDVLVSEQINLPSKVTMYPIETGDGEISDHIVQNQEEITITGAISAGSSQISLSGIAQSISSGGSFGVEFGPLCYSKLINAIDQLRTMHKDRKPITVVTGLGRYEEMAFTTLTLDRSNSNNTGGQWLQINATLRKIKKVTLKQTDLPPEKASGQDGAKGKTGKTEKKTTNGGSTSNKEISVAGQLGKRTGLEGPFGVNPPVKPPTVVDPFGSSIFAVYH